MSNQNTKILNNILSNSHNEVTGTCLQDGLLYYFGHGNLIYIVWETVKGDNSFRRNVNFCIDDFVSMSTEMFKFMRLLVDNRSSTMFSSGGPDYFLPDLKFLS